MAKTYRAIVGFTCPADQASLKAKKAARKLEGEEREAKLAAVKFMTVKAGDKVTPYNDDILKDWLERELVEEVSA